MEPTILIGVTGCIAAYKSCEIVRAFQKAGYRVKVVMTEHATHFVDPLTFRSLTHEPVAVGLFDDPSDPIHHISLAEEADVFLIAPCTANVAAKLAHGIADDLLTTTALACTAPIVVAPAMNVHMYEAAATQDNFALLKRRGVRFVEAESGYLACGDVGRGRLADPADIAAFTMRVLEESLAATRAGGDLAGKRVLVTAGPTEEPIDPVRYITNRSSGKMGYAIAEAAARRGAEVVLVSGPVSLRPPAGADVVRVRTACQMLDACEDAFPRSDIAVFCAAVADVRPQEPSATKLKKGTAGEEALLSMRFVKNPDILATLAARKREGQIVVGFAAETEDVRANAEKKLAEKGADMIVGNRVGDDAAFGKDENTAVLVSDEGAKELPEMPKRELADEILDAALALGA